MQKWHKCIDPGIWCVYVYNFFLTMNNFHWIFNMFSYMSECILPSVLFYINAIYRYIYCGDHLINCWSFFSSELCTTSIFWVNYFSVKWHNFINLMEIHAFLMDFFFCDCFGGSIFHFNFPKTKKIINFIFSA